MKGLKNNAGITLIALVITIIVLIILAGVSIAMLSGNNSILKRAQSSQAYTVLGAAKDEVNLAYNDAIAEYMKNVYANGEATTTANLGGIFKNKLTDASNRLKDTYNNQSFNVYIQYKTPEVGQTSTVIITVIDKQSNKTYSSTATLNTEQANESFGKWQDSAEASGTTAPTDDVL